MATLFLVLIYLSFISLGLPDALLGVAWPLMQKDIDASFEGAGFVTIAVTLGTILSSLVSGAVIKRFGTGKVTFISCAITASALWGFSLVPTLAWMLILAIPLGLGAGSVDAALNNYVALYYKARHMNWLHCFWGVGASLGPVIMSWFIAQGDSWRSGYFTVSELQFGLAALLFITLPLWKKQENTNETDKASALSNSEKVNFRQITGVKLALIACFFYCGTEASIGLWGSSYLVNVKQMPAAIAAQGVALFYSGITVGRLIAGFVTMKISNTMLIRLGQITALIGAILLAMPLTDVFMFVGFMMAGLGCAPIYPCILHETPRRFGEEHSQKIMGYQMAAAYTGVTVLPPLLGMVVSSISMLVLPLFLAVYILIMLISSEKINSLMKKRSSVCDTQSQIEGRM